MVKQQQPKPAISVTHILKDFALPHQSVNSIKSGVVNVFRKRDKSVEVQHALKDISFDIKKGEFFGILGRNGSGKSTLLKILAEIYRPTAGTVKTRGKLVPFIELGVGFNPELTGRENVYLNGALLGFSRKEITAKYDDIVAFAELEDFMDQKLKNYSSGMQVRLAFSVATRAEADILLVDEVLAVGDADFQRKCYSFFKDLKKMKKTVVFVTHDMSAVREYCDRAILIEDGLIMKAGGANEIANEYQKIFNKPSSAKPRLPSDVNRWGSGSATLENVSTTVGDETVIVDFSIHNISAPIDDLVVGFRIKNSTGDIVTGANSQTTRLTIKHGASRTIRFNIANIFGNDNFHIDTTLRQRDGVTICDNWDDSSTFSITRDSVLPYSLIVPADVEII